MGSCSQVYRNVCALTCTYSYSCEYWGECEKKHPLDDSRNPINIMRCVGAPFTVCFPPSELFLPLWFSVLKFSTVLIWISMVVQKQHVNTTASMNSCCAAATVNMLRFHRYHLAVLSDRPTTRKSIIFRYAT